MSQRKQLARLRRLLDADHAYKARRAANIRQLDTILIFYCLTQTRGV